MAQLAAKDRGGYAKTCADARRRAGGSANPEVVRPVLHMLVLGPDGVDKHDSPWLLQWTQKLTAQSPANWTHGFSLYFAALYRAGEFERLVKIMEAEKALTTGERILLAMASQRTGRTAQAKQLLSDLEKVVEKVEADLASRRLTPDRVFSSSRLATPRTVTFFAPTSARVPWLRVVELRLLYEEAADFISSREQKLERKARQPLDTAVREVILD